MRLGLTPIVERLRGAGCRHVEGVLEFNRLEALPLMLPAHFVVPLAERGGGNTLDAGRDQVIDVDFAVAIVVNGARLNAAGIAEDIHAEGERVKDAIAGWRHPAASRACSFSGARMGSASGSALIWEVRFTTRYHLRKAS